MREQKKCISEFHYAFNYTDHLGNVRLTYSDSDGDGFVSQDEIISEKHYYPFGLLQKGYNNTITSNANSMAERFAYNGKENNPELGLEWYDFSARNYDPALGRWMNIDPLAEAMRRHSPYNFAFDNPIYFIDPDGNMPFGCCSTLKNVVRGLIGFSRLAKRLATLDFTGDSDNSPPGNAPPGRIGSAVELETDDGDTGNALNAQTNIADHPKDNLTLQADGLFAAGSIAGAKGKSGNRTKPNSQKKPGTGKALDKAETTKTVVDGMGLGGDIAEGVEGSIESFADKDTDTTFITRRAGSIETRIVNGHHVSSNGNIEEVNVTVPESKVDSVNNASQRSLNQQKQRMDNINKEKLDSLKTANNGI